jgi:hypothetical protein
VSFGTPANAAASTALKISEVLGVGAETSDPFVVILFWSCVGKAMARFRLDKPSKRAGPRCSEYIVMKRDGKKCNLINGSKRGVQNGDENVGGELIRLLMVMWRKSR